MGCQSLAPGAAGQTSRTTRPWCGAFSAAGINRPVFMSTPWLEFTGANGAADNTSPVDRSTT